MFTRVKTSQEIENIRESGRILAEILKKVKDYAEPGVTGLDVSEFVDKEMKVCGVVGPFKGYMGYPHAICISVNDEIVHGIASDREFKIGDLISFDCGVKYKGMISDSAFSMVVGKATKTQKNLLKATEQSLYAGIEKVKDGARVGDISAAVQGVLEKNHYGIVRELVGHGVGHELHEDPNIPNYGIAGKGPMLKAGMTIAIEPMSTLGDYHIKVDPDGWTVRTTDASLAAHFEHTILVTRDGYEILTAW